MGLPTQLEVVGGERKDNEKGKWLVLYYLNSKGQTWKKNIFGDLVDFFKGNGTYAVTWKKELGGDGRSYDNIASLKPLMASQADEPPAATSAPPPKPQKSTPPAVLPANADGVDLEIKLAAIASSARLFSSANFQDPDQRLSWAKTGYLSMVKWLRGEVDPPKPDDPSF